MSDQETIEVAQVEEAEPQPKEPTPEPEPPKEPTPEPEPPKEPTPEPPKEPTPEPEPPKEPTPEPEPPKEPTPEPEPPKEPTPEPEPHKEPTPEPEPPKEPTPEPEPPKEPTPEPEPPKEPTPEPEPLTEAPAKEEEGEIEPVEVAPAVLEVPLTDDGDVVKEKPEVESVKSHRTKVRTTDPAVGVDIPMGEGELEGAKPITVGQSLQNTVKKFPDRHALGYKEDGGWKFITYSEYYQLSIGAAKSFLKLGLEDYRGVGIIGFNSKEWVISNLGAIFAGGLAFGIYATNNAEACQYIAHDCKANILVVEDQKQLDKILQVRDQLPHLKAIVQYKGKLSQNYENTYDWEQFMDLGKDIETSVIEEKMAAQKPNQCALLVYTSGTTGQPKGVMLSHDNVTWVSKSFEQHMNLNPNIVHSIISYLPLSHIAAQVADIYMPITDAWTVYFAQPDALKGSLLTTLREVEPSVFFGVPRVWEKFMAGVRAQGANMTGIKRRLSVWAKGKGLQGNRNIQHGEPMPWGWTIANILLKKARVGLGLGRCEVLLTGAAPIHREVLEYFMSLNMPVLELYGMSECAGPHSANKIAKWRLGTVGPILPGCQNKLDKRDTDGEGEVCMYGRHMFMGYLNNEEKTKEAIDDDGWLHSGDLGKVDEDGFLSITGRIKELIITAGGENIAPVPIEDRIKKAVPFLSNVVVIGDKRKFLSCLVTLLCVMDLNTGEPEDELSPVALQAIENLGSKCTKVSEVIGQKDEAVYTAIRNGLDEANKNAVSHAQKVQKFVILDHDFSVLGGELGPTLKLKRHVVNKKYVEQVDSMYEEVISQL